MGGGGRIKIKGGLASLGEAVVEDGALLVTGIGGGGATDFLSLTDTPAAYAGSASFFVKVNAAATALEFVAGGGGGVTDFLSLTDTPATYVGQALKHARVNAGETALEFIDPPVVITDHTGLTSIGVNTHAAIDTHIADATIHFTEASIDHTAIANIGANSHAAIDTHIADASIHFTVGSIDHGLLLGLADDDHLQYLLLLGRVGGQTAIGGTAAADELVLKGSSDATTGVLRTQSPIIMDEIWTAGGGGGAVFTHNDPFTASAIFLASIFSTGSVITLDPGSGITFFTAWFENSRIIVNRAPLLDAYVGVSIRGAIENSGNFNLMTSRGYEAILTHTRTSSGTSTAPQAMGMDCLFTNSATASGAILTKANDVGLQYRPKFSTATGSTVNMGIQRAVWAKAIDSAGGTDLGTETLTDYVGLEMENTTVVTATGEQVAVRSAITAGATNYFLKNNGGAQSDFGAGLNFGTGKYQFESDANGVVFGVGQDVEILWNGTSLVFDPAAAAADELQVFFNADNHSIVSNAFGVTASSLGLGFDRFGFAAQSTDETLFLFENVGPTATLAIDYNTMYINESSGGFEVDTVTVPEHSVLKVEESIYTLTSGGLITDSATVRITGQNEDLDPDQVAAIHVTGRVLVEGVLNMTPETPAQITATQSNYGGGGTDNARRTIWRMSSDATRGITGIDRDLARDGDIVCIVNVGSFNISIFHQNGASLAANRFITATGGSFNITPGRSGWFFYDTVDSRWREIRTI